MFVLIVILFLIICILSIFTVYKVLEIEKDIDTLYDNYSKEIEKLTKFNLRKGLY